MQVTQSAYLQALGYGIVNSLWQFALLWLLYLLLSSTLKISSHRRYRIALAFQLLGFTWFIGTVVYYYDQTVFNLRATASVSKDFAIQSSIFSAGYSFKERVYSLFIWGEQLLPYLSLAYMMLLVFLIIKMCRCYKQALHIRSRQLTKIDVEWRLFVQRLSFQLGIKQKVRIYLSAIVQSPVTVGFLRPLILLPLASINHLSAEQVEAILLHELAHIKRYDYIVNIMVTMVETLLFFNPFMQLISRDIKRERENSCDDWVLQYQYNAATYASALLKIALSKNNTKSPFAMAATDNKNALLVRVKRMIEKNEKTFNYRRQVAALFCITLLLMSIAWLVPERNTSIRQTATLQKINPASSREFSIKADNPLFNPVFFLAKPEKELIEKEITRFALRSHSEMETVSNQNFLKPDEIQPIKIDIPHFNIVPIAKQRNNGNLLLLKNFKIDSMAFVKEMAGMFETVLQSRHEILVAKQEGERLRNAYRAASNVREKLFDDEKVQQNIENTFKKLQELKARFGDEDRSNFNEDVKELRTAKSKLSESKIAQLEALSENMKREISILQDVQAAATHSSNNFFKATQLPAILFSAPNELTGAFSYEYKEAPKVKVSAPQKCACPDAGMIEKVPAAPDEYDLRETTPVQPQAPANGKATPRRKYYTIRI